VAAACTALDPAVFEAAWKAGRKLSLDQVIKTAIDGNTRLW